MSHSIQKLLIATSNSGKIREFKDFLDGLPFKVQSLAAFPDIAEVEESGSTFDENARLKACGYALQTGLIALADDSGLEVEGLGGRPGVLSARYGGTDTSFAEKMESLLAELEKTADTSRRARFVCSIAVANAAGQILCAAEGLCAGKLAQRPRGSGGFGYDPIFIPDGFDQTFGELDEVVKQRISHRFKAYQQIIPFLRHFEAVGLDLKGFGD